MIKKMLGVFTSVIAALAVVGIAWAGTDDTTSTSVTAAGESSTSVSIDDSSSSTDATIASSTDATVKSSTEANVAASTGATVDSSTSTSLDDSSSSTSTSLAASTSTSADSSSTTSTTVGSSTSTSVDSTTSTSTDDNDRSVVPDGVTVHTIPGVGSVTIEAALGQLILVDVTAPGWNVEFDKVESDRIELEFTSAADAEAEFEARINDGRIEVRIEVD